MSLSKPGTKVVKVLVGSLGLRVIGVLGQLEVLDGDGVAVEDIRDDGGEAGVFGKVVGEQLRVVDAKAVDLCENSGDKLRCLEKSCVRGNLRQWQ
jgi:hypothetical protein